MSTLTISAIDRVMAAIERLARVGWGRPLPGKNQDRGLVYPPLILRRFAIDESSNIKGIEDQIFELVNRFRGRVAWDIVKHGRNIVLSTKTVMDMVDSGSFRSDAEIPCRLAETDPKHGNDAHEDVAQIVDFVERLHTG